MRNYIQSLISWRNAKLVGHITVTALVAATALLVILFATACGVPVWQSLLVVLPASLAFIVLRHGVNFIKIPSIAFVLLLAVGVAVAAAGKPQYQRDMEKVSDGIATRLVGAVPYPLAEMTDSLERRMLRERLLRFNKASKTGYLYLQGMNGNVVGYFVIRGKPSATESQLTNPDQTWDCGSSDGACSAQSIEDDGSWGHEEGGSNGIFFFTAQGVMVETNDPFWTYSDAPLPLHAPQLSAPGQKPSSVSQYWIKNNGLGGK